MGSNPIAVIGFELQAVDNIPKLAYAMKDLMKTLSTAPNVSQNIIDMTNALAKLAKTGASSGKAVNSLTGAMGRLGKIGNPLKGLTRRLLSFVSIWEAIQWGKKSIEIASSLNEVENVVNVTFGKYRKLLDSFTKISLTNFGIGELDAKRIAGRFQSMGMAMGFSQGKMAEMSINLTKLAGDFASFHDKDLSEVSKKFNSVFSGETEPLRDFGLDLTQATLKEWALKNGMDANIGAMSQMEKTLLRYNYVMANSQHIMGDFVRTSDSWHNILTLLTGSLFDLGGTVGTVLINVLKPLVTWFTNAVIAANNFAKAISNSLGKIFGWKFSETSNATGGLTNDLENASDASEGVGGGLGKAADNAKKLKQQLQGFDELNVLTSDSGSGGSGGSAGGVGGASGAGSTGGQWTKEESLLDDYKSSLDSLYKLGDYIGTTLTRTLNNIDWESVYEGARNFGSGLASFLNGLISPDLFGALGKTVAGAINTALQALNSFGETFEWKEFGASIARGITKFFETWDAKLTGETFSNFARGVLQSLSGFFSTLSEDETFRTIGQKIADFICNIDWAGLAWDFGNLAISLGKAIIDGLDGLFQGSADEFAKELAPMWENLETWFSENFKFKTPDLPTFDDLKSGFEELVASVKTWWSENVKLPDIQLPSIGNILGGIQTAWANAKNWWSENAKLPSISASVSSIKDKLSSAWSTAKTWWSKKGSLSSISIKVSSIKSKLKSAWTTAKNWWKKNKPSLSAITAKIKIPRLKVTWDTKGVAAKALQKLGLKGFPNFSVAYYASGGFPEDGWFRANHGELMGKFDNGKSVVANNKQITQGIADAVYQGNRENNALMRQELELMRRQNELLANILGKETGISAGELFSSVRQSANDYKRRTGRPAFSW